MARKLTNDDKIINAFDALDKSVKNLNKFGEKYNEHIDRAAIRGDDARAKQLIRQKVGVYELADQLTTLKGNIELGVYTSKVIADLGALPDAISACRGLLSESPNFKKLGSDIERIFRDMKRPVGEINRLNEILDDALAPAPSNSLTSRLDGADSFENSDAYKAEYAAMLERIKGKVAGEAVAKPSAIGNDATEDIDYAGLIDEENKKK